MGYWLLGSILTCKVCEPQIQSRHFKLHRIFDDTISGSEVLCIIVIN